LNDKWIIKEIKVKFLKMLKSSERENIPNKNNEDASKTMLREKYIARIPM
jgi:hypothetical protein